MSRGVLGLKPVTKSAETTLRQNLSMVARLRRHRFEVLIKLVTALGRKPGRVFPGNLTLVQLAAVIQHSALHLCGDTGTLHLALMTGAPAVSWFRSNPGMKMWIPVSDKYRTIVGTTGPDSTYLGGIKADELVNAACAVLRANLRPG
jgi:ADP-heptose:LPS heptosyltransferase